MTSKVENKLYENSLHAYGHKAHVTKTYSALNLKIKNSFKYLGVVIDPGLKWTLHIDELCKKKVGRMISYLGRVGNFVNESSLKWLYNSAIMPHFDYSDVIWHSAAQTNLDMLQKLQNRAGRIILKVKSCEHKSINEMHDILNWDTLQKRNSKHTYSMMYKILHDMTPEYLRENVTYKSYFYSLRQSENLALPIPNTQNCKRTFEYRGSKLYNELPMNIRQSGATSIHYTSSKPRRSVLQGNVHD